MTEQPPARTKDDDPILDPKAYVLARRDPAERSAFAVVAATLESTAVTVALCFSSEADAREAMAAQHLEGEDDIAETTFERVSAFENLVRRLAVAGTAWIAVNPPPLLEGNWRLLTPGAAVAWARQSSSETLVDYHARAIEAGLYGASVDRTRGRRDGGPVRPNRKPDDDVDHRKGR